MPEICLARSALTGDPCVAIATLNSDNRKTGPIPQVWFLPVELYPSLARQGDLGCAVCGDCPLRQRWCYVNGQTINNIYKAWKQGKHQPLDPAFLSHYPLTRIGAFGDPACLPASELLSWQKKGLFNNSLSYTRQWLTVPLSWLGMASCFSALERDHAKAFGFRTFRVRPVGSPLLAGEVQCPASQADFVTCTSCRLCQPCKKAKDVSVEAHGNLLKWTGEPL